MPEKKKLHKGTVKDGVQKGRKWFKLGSTFITEAKYNAVKARRAASGKPVAKPKKAIAEKKTMRTDLTDEDKLALAIIRHQRAGNNTTKLVHYKKYMGMPAASKRMVNSILKEYGARPFLSGKKTSPKKKTAAKKKEHKYVCDGGVCHLVK